MQIHNWLILQHVRDTSKQISCVFQEITSIVHLADTPIWRKRARHRVPTNEIGDGMQWVHILGRPFLIPSLDIQWVIKWMSIFQEFDEDVGFMKTYMYKFSKQDDVLHHVQSIMKNLLPWYSLVRDGRFIQLRWEQVSYEQDLEKFSIWLSHWWISCVLSYLWWLCMWYGDVCFSSMPDSLHITIPLVGSITTREPYIHKIISVLQDHGMYISVQTQNQSFGQSLQIRITDREIIAIFAHWLWYTQEQVLRKKTYEHMKKWLIAWLQKQTVDTWFLDKIEYSVLKLIKK